MKAAHKAPDLIIAPQAGHYAPANHLTPQQQQNTLESWKAWGTTTPPPGAETWTVHIVHVIDGVPTVTAVREIPRITD